MKQLDRFTEVLETDNRHWYITILVRMWIRFVYEMAFCSIRLQWLHMLWTLVHSVRWWHGFAARGRLRPACYQSGCDLWGAPLMCLWAEEDARPPSRSLIVLTASTNLRPYVGTGWLPACDVTTPTTTWKLASIYFILPYNLAYNSIHLYLNKINLLKLLAWKNLPVLNIKARR